MQLFSSASGGIRALAGQRRDPGHHHLNRGRHAAHGGTPALRANLHGKVPLCERLGLRLQMERVLVLHVRPLNGHGPLHLLLPGQAVVLASEAHGRPVRHVPVLRRLLLGCCVDPTDGALQVVFHPHLGVSVAKLVQMVLVVVWGWVQSEDRRDQLGRHELGPAAEDAQAVRERLHLHRILVYRGQEGGERAVGHLHLLALCVPHGEGHARYAHRARGQQGHHHIASVLELVGPILSHLARQ
mmetsp:Transcript_42568/g.122230  ORF Transcript_42568/g.122230 Transcript_42568/m.122230 type:complete len:242 (-) Transcript_42568:921-1646(-)